MKSIVFFLLLMPLIAYNQIITTYVGTGSAGGSGDGGLATNAELGYPVGIALDKNGNLLTCEEDNIRIVNMSTNIISTIAGSDTATSTGNGRLATNASLIAPYTVCIDASGNLYIADNWTFMIRIVDISTSIINDYVGTGTEGVSGVDGLATAAELYSPFGVCIDTFRKYLYLSDEFSSRVMKVDMTTNIITLFAGSGVSGYSGDGGLASVAKLSRVLGICLDHAGNLYIGDWDNERIRKVDVTTNIITTVAGNGTVGYLGDGGPATSAEISKPTAICFDKCDNMYIADEDSSIVRKIDVATQYISTVVGNGVIGFSGDSGPATNASLDHPDGICMDNSGDLYIADYYNQRVRKVTFSISCDTALIVNQIKTNLEITIFPNPSTNELTITSNTQINKITITNLIGQTVASPRPSPRGEGVTTLKVDISGLPEGVYMVAVIDEDGNKVVRKVVKE